MPSKSKQQYKQYAINTIEDACAVLKGLIVPVILDMEKFEQYSKEAQEILIKYKNVEEIPADVYDSVHDKLLYQQRELLRFIADHQTSSFSYIDVRKKFEKQGFLKRKLSTRSSETLNELLELRNWSFHNVQSMFVADIELAKRSIPPELQGIAEIKPMLNPIVIRKVKIYKREMLEGFVHHNSVRLEQFKVVLSDMKEDYQEMFSLLPDQSSVIVGIGKNSKVQYVVQEISGQSEKSAGKDIAAVSMGIQKGRFDGTDEAIQKLLRRDN